MLFEPETLLMLARRAGLTLQRRGHLLDVYGSQPLSQEWADVLKAHKWELLPHLPEARAWPGRLDAQPALAIPSETQPGETLDLFGAVHPQPARRPTARRNRLAGTAPQPLQASGPIRQPA